MLSLASHSHVLQDSSSCPTYEASAINLHWAILCLPAVLFCVGSQLHVPNPLAFAGLIKPEVWPEVGCGDLRWEANSLFQVASSFQSHAATSCPAFGFSVQALGCFSLSQTNFLVTARWDDRGGRAWMVVCLLSSVNARHLSTWLCHQV